MLAAAGLVTQCTLAGTPSPGQTLLTQAYPADGWMMVTWVC